MLPGPWLQNPTPRRGFIRWTAGALLLCLAPRRAWAKKVGLALAKVPALQTVGGAALLQIKGLEMLLVRDTPNSVRAIDPNCTHKRCKVNYNAGSGKLHCKCHRSAFKLDGTVVGGPAPRPPWHLSGGAAERPDRHHPSLYVNAWRIARCASETPACCCLPCF